MLLGEMNKGGNVKKFAVWKDHLQDVYKDFEEWKSYSEMFGLCERLGYESDEEAWEANPLIQGSEQPEEFKVVKSQVKGGDDYSVIFDFYGDEEDVKKLHDAPMDYFEYEEDSEYPDNYTIERWIPGEFLLDYIDKLDKHEGVGDLIIVKNLDTDDEYEGWGEVRRLVKEFMQRSYNLKIVKSQGEKEPTEISPLDKFHQSEKEFELEYMTSYDDINFAINWKDRIPTDEEMENLRKFIIEEGYDEENFEIFTFDIYLEQIYDILKSECPEYFSYIDEALMIRDDVLNGSLEVIKTPSGYATVRFH